MSQFKRFTAVLLLGLLLSQAPQVSAASKLANLRKQMAQAAHDISLVRGRLRSLKVQQHTASKQLAYAERKLHVTKVSLNDIRTQLTQTQKKLAATKAELAVIERRLQRRNKLLGTRLSDTYKHGTVSYLSVLLGANDVSDLLSRTYVVHKMVQGDMRLINAIKEDQADVIAHKAELEAQVRKRADLEAEQAQLTRQAYSQTVARSQALGEIARDRTKYEQLLAELEHNSNQIGSMIRRLEQTPKGRKSLARAFNGRFIRPVSGRITSGFGMRFHPIVKRYKMHTGVDLAASSGTPIKAAASGEVIYAGWFGAYGNAVIIDHGGGVTTLYGHQSRIAIRNGASVRQGQIIGYVGSTGWSTGPHLHFEVRRHGNPVSPL